MLMNSVGSAPAGRGDGHRLPDAWYLAAKVGLPRKSWYPLDYGLMLLSA